jgi:molybdopterin molybdotransferase
MLSVAEAEKIILNLVQPICETETISLENASDRILAESITSKQDFPYWDNSAMDGYAVKYKDVQNASSDNPVKLKIIEEISAGYVPKKELQSGETARIFTGAMLPLGADTVVMQENTHKEDDCALILKAPRLEEAVRKKGEFYQSGTQLLNNGIKINPPEMAILATAQRNRIKVFNKPKIAFFSTGNELIKPHEELKKGKIIDSNQYLLASFIQKNNCIPLNLGIIPDNLELLTDTILQATSQAKFIISTGGVSVGEYDYIDEIITNLGGKIRISSIGIKPGKPLTFATFENGSIYFGIPGNPVSVMVLCWRFVQPALLKLSGLGNNYQPIFVRGKTRQNLYSKGKRETYLWGKLYLVNGEYEFELATGLHSSGNLINLAQTNALAVFPVNKTLIEAGESIRIMLVDQPF